jgi:hypothetical protein
MQVSCGRARVGTFDRTPLLVLWPVPEHATEGPETRRRFGPGRAAVEKQAEGGQGRAGQQEPPVRLTDGQGDQEDHQGDQADQDEG